MATHLRRRDIIATLGGAAAWPLATYAQTMRAITTAIIALVTTAASAQEMKAPRVSSALVDWSMVRNSLNLPEPLRRRLALPARPKTEAEMRIASEKNQLGLINQATNSLFANIALSPVPVLLPFDTVAFLRDLAQESNGPKKTSTYLAGFSASKVFIPGPAGYDAALQLDVSRAPALNTLRYRGEAEVQISGSSVIYELTSPTLGDALPLPAGLQDRFPGIRRVLHDGSVRYTFVRYGAPYMISIPCNLKSASKRTMLCTEADQVISYFLNSLQLVGGTPTLGSKKVAAPTLDRPNTISKVFTYYRPGSLLDHTGYDERNGRADYTVYANIRFPIDRAPAFANSQVFMHGGNCYGASEPKPKKKNDPYQCTVNNKQLYFFEGRKENFSYPWRDNFCEERPWTVGQCPGGHGHQGQDIRPGAQGKAASSSGCEPDDKNSARCEPYLHDAVAVSNSYVWRSKGQEALFLVVNEPNQHIKFRYLHMLPDRMDRDGLITAKTKYVREGDKIGKVGNYEEGPNGTTYHLHFDIQVPTKDGWVWVNPYMTLVSAYERLIGAKGAEVHGSPEQAQPAGGRSAASDRNF